MRQLKIALTAAQAALDRWAAQPHASVAVFRVSVFATAGTPGTVPGDEAGYRHLADRYRGMALEFGFEGHIAMAEAMT